MTEEFDFMAPTGDELQGTAETVLSAASIYFTGSDPAADYSHAGESEVFWDTSTTETLQGAPMFTDASGFDWPAHHLIPADAEPLSDETLRLFRIEIAIGRALGATAETLERLRGALKAIGSQTPETAETISRLTRFHERDREHRPPRRASSLWDGLAEQYAAAKCASIAAKDRELKAQAKA